MASLRAAIVSAVLLALSAGAPAPGATLRDACDGCDGHGSSSSGTTGGFTRGIIELTVVGVDGSCGWLWSDSLKRVECRPRRGCRMTVTRTWRDFPRDIEVDHCVELGSRQLCLSPRPTSDLGWGRTVRTGPRMTCAPDSRMWFIASSDACDIALKSEGICGQCVGRV